MNKYKFYGLSLVLFGTIGVYAQADTITESVLIKRAEKTQIKKEKTRIITGRIISASTQMPFSGALVSVYGYTHYSALTAEDGSFSLEAPLHASAIQVAAPDYNLVKAGINKSGKLNDILIYTHGVKSLYSEGENVLSSAIADDFEFSSALNISSEIGEQLGADVRTILRSGTPGIGSYMTIGGIHTLTGNAQPLILIDGVIIDQQYSRTMLHQGFYNDILTNLNVNDIEKVEVLKNGTAIYGAKGGNGVILIQTKRNKSLATRINATVSAGITLQPKMYSLMNGNQYKTYAADLLQSTGTESTNFKFLSEDPNYYYYNKYNNNTDWSEHVYREAVSQNYNVNVQGGGDVASYNLAMGYAQVQSTLKENETDRLNIRFNTDIKLSSDFLIRFDASFANQTRNLRDIGASEDYDNGTVTAPNYLAWIKSPMLSPYSYANGVISNTNYDTTDEDYLDEALANKSKVNYKLANPVCINKYGSAQNKNYFENSMVNIAFTPKWQINKHLFVSSLFSYNLVNTNEKYYLPMNGVPDYYVDSFADYVQNEARSLYSKQNSVTSDTKLDWTNQYGAHSIHLMGGFRYTNDSYSLNTQVGYNTGNDKTPFISSALAFPSTGGINNNWATLSWYGQAAYNYKQRYFLQGDIAMQASSAFGKEAKEGIKLCGVVWGVFPSIQGAWVMSNEKWFDIQEINYLKLSAGYGMSGNDDMDFDASRSYFKSKLYLNKGAGLTLVNIGNAEIQWETTKRFNAGLDMNLLKNRLNLKFNYFLSHTDNLLTYKELKAVTGLQYNWSNGGSLKNEGFDVSANALLIAGRKWNWELGASVGHYVNKLTALPDENLFMDTEVYGATIRSQVGRAVSMFYGYRTDKTESGTSVYATSEEAQRDGLYVLGKNGIDKTYFGAGDVKFVDRNGDHIIDAKDMDFIGDPNPDIYGNIFTSLSYKRIRLDVNFNYSLGGDVYNYVRSQLEGGGQFFNQTTNMLSRWSVEGQVTHTPKPTWDDPMGNGRFSDRWIEDGSFLRLKSLTLSYNIPINNEFIHGITVWGQANNLFTLSKYLGADPEFSMSNSVLEQGIDRGLLSNSRSFLLGVKINL